MQLEHQCRVSHTEKVADEVAKVGVQLGIGRHVCSTYSDWWEESRGDRWASVVDSVECCLLDGAELVEVVDNGHDGSMVERATSGVGCKEQKSSELHWGSTKEGVRVYLLSRRFGCAERERLPPPCLVSERLASIDPLKKERKLTRQYHLGEDTTLLHSPLIQHLERFVERRNV